MNIPQDIRKLVRTAKRAGWTITRTRNGHIRFRHPSGHPCLFTGSTTSDHRRAKKLRCDLRRAGLKC